MTSKPKQKTKPETPDEKFERVSSRVVNAVEELNDALKEAHQQTSMTVGLTMLGSDEYHPQWPWKRAEAATITYHIARITKCSMALRVREIKSVEGTTKQYEVDVSETA